MIFRRLHHESLAQAGYLLACQETRIAVVVDPLRDVEPYLAAAAEEEVRIAFVAETHLHADFLSGAEELARRAGATLLLSAERGNEPGGDLAALRIERTGARSLRDGDVVPVGKVLLHVRATPGHTPEHLIFVVTDTAVSVLPMGALTGDFLFVGDVGRPDLLERSAGVEGATKRLAARLFESIQSIGDLPDFLQVWPGHGAGSACGKSLSAVPQSTLGFERQTSWAFRPRDERAFVEQVLADQPDPPAYFGRVKAANARGAPPMPARQDADEQALIGAARGAALVVDTRAFELFAAGHLPGSLSIRLGRSFLQWVGAVVDPDRDLVLLAAPGERTAARLATRELALIGFDRVLGTLAPEELSTLAPAPLETADLLAADALSTLGDDAAVVDVRTDAEWNAGHVPGAIHLPLTRLRARVGELHGSERVAVYCQSGTRSAIAASILLASGVRKVASVAGGYSAWQRAASRPARTGH